MSLESIIILSAIIVSGAAFTVVFMKMRQSPPQPLDKEQLELQKEMAVVQEEQIRASRQYTNGLHEQIRASQEQTNRIAQQTEVSREQVQQMAEWSAQLAKTLEFQRDAQRQLEGKQSVQSENIGLNSGGYIIFDMPDTQKGLFHDLLKGFEDYAKLRGYVISFSIDNSFANKTAFKFTLDSSGIVVSTKQIRHDLKEYIEKVQRGDSLDDLPVILPAEEHNVLLVAMKNRINFLQHTYTLQKNVIDFYNGLFKKLPNHGFGVAPHQNFYLQAGDSNQASNYHALNSPQSVQGVGNRLIGNTLDQGIHIANSFNERKAQVDAVNKLYWDLYREEQRIKQQDSENVESSKLDEARKHLKKVSDELEEEEQPDPTRIHRWLENAKHSLKAFALTKELSDAAKVVWEAFKISF